MSLLLSELAAAHDVPVSAVSLDEDTRRNLADIEAGCERNGSFGETSAEEGEEGEARRRMTLAIARRRLQTLTYTFVIDPDLAGRAIDTDALAADMAQSVAAIAARQLNSTTIQAIPVVVSRMFNVTRNVSSQVAATCPRGSWCTAGSQIACGVGTYNPEENSDSAVACRDCPLHTTTLTTGASSEDADCVCDTQNQRFPVPVVYRVNGKRCGCRSGQRYAEALEACMDCDRRTTSVPGARACGYCAEGFFLLRLNRSVADEPEVCQPCLAGATCITQLPAGLRYGGDLTTLVIKPGWWRLSNQTTDLRSCEGGEEGGCLGGESVGRCRAGQSGPMCAPWRIDSPCKTDCRVSTPFRQPASLTGAKSVRTACTTRTGTATRARRLGCASPSGFLALPSYAPWSGCSTCCGGCRIERRSGCFPSRMPCAALLAGSNRST